jgi:hypothetical protein
MRAQRRGLTDAPVSLGAETALRDSLTTLDAERPDLAVIDSIQTMWLDTVDSAPGSVSQVRAAAHELVTFAKRRGVAVILVGHVTKDGQIAGPRVVEHMVDTVLYFEGERGHQFRILRAVKNRFGPADEIGVFEMTGDGLAQVTNPSALFLSDRGQSSPGSAVFAGKDSQGQRRDYAGAVLAGGDLYALLSAPAPGLLSWARLNPIGTLLLPLGAWLTAFAAVMLLSERIFIRWLDYLERIAALYARGRFSVRPLQAMNAPSEIRVMARTLDEMAEAITQRDLIVVQSVVVVLVFAVALFLGLPFPFAPIQIILLELFMDLAASATFNWWSMTLETSCTIVAMM